MAEWLKLNLSHVIYDKVWSSGTFSTLRKFHIFWKRSWIQLTLNCEVYRVKPAPSYLEVCLAACPKSDKSKVRWWVLYQSWPRCPTIWSEVLNNSLTAGLASPDWWDSFSASNQGAISVSAFSTGTAHTWAYCFLWWEHQQHGTKTDLLVIHPVNQIMCHRAQVSKSLAWIPSERCQ